MRFVYGKIDWSTSDRGQENCYLLTNGLGGFSSQSMIGSNARNDQALLMACLCAPVDRYHMITRLEEEVIFADSDGESDYEIYEDSRYAQGKGGGFCGKVSLSGQQYVDYTKNQDGQKYLQSFVVEDLPVWMYQVGGLQICKTVVMRHGENTVGVSYRMKNRGKKDAKLVLTPLFEFVTKGSVMPEQKPFEVTVKPYKGGSTGNITDGKLTVHFAADGVVETFETAYVEDLYYAHDSRDGRPAVGRCASNHRIISQVPAGAEVVCDVIYSMERDFIKDADKVSVTAEALIKEEKQRLQRLVELSGLKDEVACQLAKAADQFVVERESTGGKSIIAGYPFFGDWGRDTMIAMIGCCISTRRYEDAKNIFRTFMKYCKNGIMPNMFPEGENPPMYNTVDASLLFILAVYEYYQSSKDLAFVKESFDTMKEVLDWYQKGTDFHIHMDEDGLISAGGGLEQVTWMDVRFQKLLPTPRHGKPVEMNAYWYHDLCVMQKFALLLAEEERNSGAADGSMTAQSDTAAELQALAGQWEQLAQKVKKSFGDKFWNAEKGCLKDVLAAEETELSEVEKKRRKNAENQIRCNQIWAVSQQFCALDEERRKAVTDVVFEKLYTPRGLRSLAMEDMEFRPQYTGTWKHRDLCYHQGTVWGFPLGAYFLSYLKVNDNSEKAKAEVKEQLAGIEGALREGCIGQLAEVYDGENPTVSEGCFAQAWSTAELLRVYAELEKE
ncbi:MAG: glycogen debranching enzyme family protein [Lachnospiraceae bacterium]|nr:glycogen debranching enzyme family protein [Lachnospiraceae bacterium]